MHLRQLLGATVAGLLVVPGVALSLAGTAAAAPATTSITTTTPQTLTIGGVPKQFKATTHAQPPPGDAGKMVRVHFTLTDPAGITPADLTLKYDDGTGDFVPLSLTATNGTTLAGGFGPSAGFPLTDGAVFTFSVRANDAATPSTVTSTAQVVLASDGSPLGAPSSDTTDLTTTAVRTTYPSTTDALGAASTYRSTVDSSAGAACTSSYTVTITGGDGFAAGDVQLTLNGNPVDPADPEGSSFTATAPGQPVAAGETGADDWTIRYVGPPVDLGGAQALSVSTTATCNGTSTETGSVRILRPTVTVDLPPTIVKGQPTPFSAMVANKTHSDYTQVRVVLTGCDAATVESDCPGQLKTGDLTLSAYDPRSKSFTALTCEVNEGQFGCLLPAAVSFAKGTTSSQDFRVTVAGSSAITHLAVGIILATDENLLADAAASATVTVPVQARPNPPVSGGTVSVSGGSTLPETGAPALPQTVGAGAALLLLGLLLSVAGRRARRGQPTG